MRILLDDYVYMYIYYVQLTDKSWLITFRRKILFFLLVKATTFIPIPPHILTSSSLDASKIWICDLHCVGFTDNQYVTTHRLEKPYLSSLM